MKTQWPLLSFQDAKATYATLHRWAQIIGKIKLATMPWINHSWGVTLYPSVSGLTTHSIPYGDFSFQIELDFAAHLLRVSTSANSQRSAPLKELSVAGFYRTIFTLLDELDIHIRIDPRPAEMPHAIRLDEDHAHSSYDELQVAAMHRAFLLIEQVLLEYRSGFVGKASPVQLFWGGFDLSLTLFSGARAPKHPGSFAGLPDSVLQDAYSHEICETGFSLGSKGDPQASFYCSVYPVQSGYDLSALMPEQAVYDAGSGAFSLAYDAVRRSADPHGMLLDFFTSAYQLTTGEAGWDTALRSPKVWSKGKVSALMG